MRYEVYCTSRDCYLREPYAVRDLVTAETLAHAHQQRFIDVQPTHIVILKDLNPPVPSKDIPEPGGKEAPHA